MPHEHLHRRAHLVANHHHPPPPRPCTKLRIDVEHKPHEHVGIAQTTMLDPSTHRLSDRLKKIFLVTKPASSPLLPQSQPRIPHHRQSAQLRTGSVLHAFTDGRQDQFHPARDQSLNRSTCDKPFSENPMKQPHLLKCQGQCVMQPRPLLHHSHPR